MSDNATPVSPRLVVDTGATAATRRIANAMHKALARELNLDHEVHAYAPTTDSPYGRVVYNCMRLGNYCDFEVELLDDRGSEVEYREDVHGVDELEDMTPSRAVKAWLEMVREYEAWKEI